MRPKDHDVFRPHRLGKSVVASTTTLTWETFIPQAKVNAPPKGCKYSGSSYQYGGDNHGYDWTSSRYRTALHAVITWKDKSVKGYKSVRPTTVYRKKDGAFISSETASSKDMAVKKLGSGSNYVDLRMVNSAHNPFCSVGSIDGAITIRIYTDGYWEIRSGTHRLAPNHYMFVFNGGRVSEVYRRSMQSILCLIGSAACDSANLTGFTGTFR